MASDNSDSDDSLSDFQLTDNIKKETSNDSTASTSSSDEPSLSECQSSARKLPTSNKSCTEEPNISINKTRAKVVSTINSSSLPANLQHYISKYDSRYISQSGAEKALVEIDSDEEVFIVQTIKEFNLKEFIDKKLNIEKKNQLETSDGITLEYYIENFSKKPNLSLIFGDKVDNAMKVNTIKPGGKIIIREKLFTGETSDGFDALQIEQSKKVPFPRDLKTRHPLLGAFYEDKINLSKKVLKQLKTPRKMKKIKTELSNENVTIKTELLDYAETIDEEVSPEKHKRSKKFKREWSVELETDAVDNIVESTIKRSPKKKKAKLENFDDENDMSWLSQI